MDRERTRIYVDDGDGDVVESEFVSDSAIAKRFSAYLLFENMTVE